MAAAAVSLRDVSQARVKWATPAGKKRPRDDGEGQSVGMTTGSGAIGASRPLPQLMAPATPSALADLSASVGERGGAAAAAASSSSIAQGSGGCTPLPNTPPLGHS